MFHLDKWSYDDLNNKLIFNLLFSRDFFVQKKHPIEHHRSLNLKNW